MEIVFSGICCIVDAQPPKSGKTVIVRNALQGGRRGGKPIPPHYAFVHAKRDQIDSRNWGLGWAGSDDNILLWLTGDYLTFDPVPGGGAIDLSALPHVALPGKNGAICSEAEEIRPGFVNDPATANVLALIDLPADADVSCGANERGSAYASLHFPAAPVTITATPFPDGTGIARSVTITDPDAEVFIANVDINGYLLGSTARDDDHRYLVCEIFRQRQVAAFPALTAGVPAGRGVSTMLAEVEPEPRGRAFDRVTLNSLQRAAGRGMRDFLCTFAAGCSASQWP
jgi:hypothetical protein